MKGRTVAILAILLVALASTTTFEARQNGIGKGGDGGCSCHGGMTPDTVITVDDFQRYSTHQKNICSH